MRRLLALACAIVFIDTVFYAALVPLIPYYAGEFGLSKFGAGLLNGAFGGGIVVGAAPGAYLASRIGVKPTALAGLALLSVTSLFFGFADSAWLLVALRLGEGFGSAFSWIAAFTWITSTASEERRGQMIGTLISAAVVGSLLGPLLGAAADRFGIAPTFATVAGAGALVFAWASTQPASRPAERPSFRALKEILRPRLATGIALISISPLLFSVLSVLAPLEFSRFGWGAFAIGAVLLAGALFETTVHPVLGRWSDRTGYRRPVTFGLVTSVLLLLLLPWAPNAWLLALLVVLAAGIFNSPLTPGTALFTAGADKAGIGQALGFGVTNVAWASGYGIGAPVGGALADFGGDLVSYSALAVVCLLVLFVLRRVV